MSPTHTRKAGRLYRYYTTTSVTRLGPETCPIRRVSASEIEAVIIGQLRSLLRAPELIVRTFMAARQEDEEITEAEVREALVALDPLWEELFPAEQAPIVQLLVERVDLTPKGASIRIRTDGLNSLATELRSHTEMRRAA